MLTRAQRATVGANARPPLLVLNTDQHALPRTNPDVAVHVHVYYSDLLPEITRYLQHIPTAFTLYATTDSQLKARQIRNRFRAIEKITALRLHVSPNRGRDLAPMVAELGQQLAEHELVLHIHTKKSPHNPDLRGWRRYLFQSVLGSEGTITAIFREFEKDQSLGVMFPPPYRPILPFVHIGANTDHVYRLLRKMDPDRTKVGRPESWRSCRQALEAVVPQVVTAAWRTSRVSLMANLAQFPAGSMFWLRGKAMKRIANLRLSPEEFEQEAGQDDGTLAHAVERMFVYLASLDGYSARTYLPDSMYHEPLPGALPLTAKHLVETVGASAESILVFDHNLGGGTESYVRGLINVNAANGSVTVRVYYGENGNWIVQVIGADDGCIYAEQDRERVFAALSMLAPKQVVINSVINIPDIEWFVEQVIDLSLRWRARLDCNVHDFYAVCPSQHLLGPDNSYCGVPTALDVCERCLLNNPNTFWEKNHPSSIEQWRRPFKKLFGAGSNIAVFDESSISILRQAFGEGMGRVVLAPHSSLSHFPEVRSRRQSKRVNVGTFGTLTYAKGARVINDLARYVARRRIDMSITLVGDAAVGTVPNVRVLGHYDHQALPKIVRHYDISVFFMASIVPETFSYTITEAMEMGLPIVAFDLGAQGNRVARYKKGVVIPLNSPMEAIAEALVKA
ncbi:MAG: glycosyltransferase, partial [Nitrospira sp.]|nr:glycosyltransferase [Nitrospira sp.]